MSLYLLRPSSETAGRVMDTLETALPIPPFLRFEFENALRYGAFQRARGQTQQPTQQQAMVALALFEADMEHGRLRLIEVDLARIFEAARVLSATYTWVRGTRTFDLLHLACARVLGCTSFLTFDQQQQSAAQAEGFRVEM